MAGCVDALDHVGGARAAVRTWPNPPGRVLSVSVRGHAILDCPWSPPEVSWELVDARPAARAFTSPLAAALFPGFADYEQKTDGVIPVVALTRR
jgi:hypothetical protein